MADIWRPTKRWRPGRTGTASKGFGVEHEDTHELGFAKLEHAHKEKLASDLAKHIVVPVSRVRLGQVEGVGAQILLFRRATVDSLAILTAEGA